MKNGSFFGIFSPKMGKYPLFKPFWYQILHRIEIFHQSYINQRQILRRLGKKYTRYKILKKSEIRCTWYTMVCNLKNRKSKIENRQMSSDFNEIWGMWVIFGAESTFLVFSLFFLVKMVKKCHFMHV